VPSAARAEPVDRVWTPVTGAEKGITILARTRRAPGQPQDPGDAVTINVVDTPGHADVRRRVERGLAWWTACCCCGRERGPLPQTRFVLRKNLRRPAGGIVVNQGGPPTLRITRSSPRRHDLAGLAAELTPWTTRATCRCLRLRRAGRASSRPGRREMPDSENLDPLF